jgi:RsiW-degrading membrane proteinase PrsW (M82 family)
MRLRFRRQSWFQILFFGLITFFALSQAARTTENPNYYPSVIALGAFLIPAAFVAWVYGHTRAVKVPLGTVGLCFLWGGLAGTILAGLIEYETLRGLGAVALLGVGIIEEGAKLAGPAILYLRGRFQRESEGILFGVASGMGFAAFETMGYGFVTLIQSQGSITDVEMTLFVRGVLSPAGHAGSVVHR